jgi:hypothetical protein
MPLRMGSVKAEQTRRMETNRRQTNGREKQMQYFTPYSAVEIDVTHDDKGRSCQCVGDY